MIIKKIFIFCLAVLVTLGLASTTLAKKKPNPPGLASEATLGKLLYFDRNLSANQDQACASCHDPNAGWADPLNVRLPVQFQFSAGSFTDLFGGRNAPPAGYAMFSPPFFFDAAAGLYTGGQFWDGRAATLKDQAKGPFLNPVEMAMADETAVIAALKDPANPNAVDYQFYFLQLYGIDLSAIDTTPVVPPAVQVPAVITAYDKLAQAIGEFEKTEIFAPFSSKWDEVQAGNATFTPLEAQGELLFNTKAQCNLCHPGPLFTDFTYDNLGIPPLNGDYTNPDLGLGAGDNSLVAAIDLPLQEGKFKVSSLRNIAMTPPYGHNGFFATLKEIVHFYNTAGDGTWPAPEVNVNVNRGELGNLLLTPQEEDAVVAFLKTLTDRTP